MNYKSALSIGHVHRFLTQPLQSGEDGIALQSRLRKNLRTVPQDALSYVCVDLDRLPSGKLEKAQLINRLVEWVRHCDSLNTRNLTTMPANAKTLASNGTDSY